MQQAEFDFIRSRLNAPKDVDLLHERCGYEKDMLFNILAKKIVRRVMKDYYVVKKHERHMHTEWKKGKTLLELSREVNFPPVLTAKFILEQEMSAKKFRALLCEPEKAPSARLKKELAEVIANDFVYSPSSNKSQAEHGRKGEGGIETWLKKEGEEFLTEKEHRVTAEGGKTPDFLLKKPMKVMGETIHWVESKASFGDGVEMNRDYKKQVLPYKTKWGKGMIVYWYGLIEERVPDKDIIYVDREFFRSYKS